MKKLSKKDQDKHTKLIGDLRDTQLALEGAITKFNDDVSSLFTENVAPVLAYFNDAIDAANEFMQDAANEAQEHYDNRSEKWQDSDAGNALTAWIDTWGEELQNLDIDEPEPIDEPDTEEIERFEQLPMAVDE